MNKLTLYTFVVCASLVIAACGHKKDEAAANDNEWPEMDKFHMIMAESFHPFKDSLNLAPAKANANEMATLAEKWANAPLPEKVDNEDTKASLTQLKADTEAFIQIAQSGDTVKIGASLTALHDQFHKLQESWYGGHKEGGQDEHKH
jgi:hypothetical protein